MYKNNHYILEIYAPSEKKWYIRWEGKSLEWAKKMAAKSYHKARKQRIRYIQTTVVWKNIEK